jgi:hypothetical protein
MATHASTWHNPQCSRDCLTLNKWIMITSVLVIGCLMAGLCFALAWHPINHGDQNLITVRGTLEPGVEAGCVILRTEDDAQYLLMDWPNYPPAGTRVEVAGYSDNSMASYCMQGEVAVHVISITKWEPNSVTVSASISCGTGSQTASTATVTAGTIEQSTTITRVSVTVSGNIYSVVENPECYPQCLAPSFILTYLYVAPGTGCTASTACYPAPRYFQLLNITGNRFWTTTANGTYATVTGTLVIPSSWNCNSFYVPRLCMSGDIYTQNITYP